MKRSSDAPESKIRLHRRAAMKLGGGLAMGVAHASVCQAKGAQPVRALPYEEYAKHDGLGLADLVKRGKVKPEELLEAAIARAGAVNDKINAIVGTLHDEACREIAQGVPDGPFRGVPYLMKDLSFAMAGVTCSHGSRLFADYKPKADSTAVERYRKAGLVFFARTATPELGLFPTTESLLFGITRNPWNLDRTAGGSSGGTAAAVAAGIAPMGSASDGGGSIRIPASCCGLFGLKPTRARVPLGPGTFESWGGLVANHAITRSVRDSAALLDATAGPALGDAYRAPLQRPPFLDEVRTPPQRLRIGLTLAGVPGATVHAECCEAANSAARLCESLGHDMDEVTDEFGQAFSFDELRQAMMIFARVGIAQRIENRLVELGRDLTDSDVEPITALVYEQAKKYSALDLAQARDVVHRSSRQMAEFQQGYDVILSPTLASPPIRHGVISASSSPQSIASGIVNFIAFTPIANWTGQPAMSVPLHWTPDGLPVGVHFMGRFGDEATLFRLAGQLEEAQPWADKRPVV